MCDRERRHARQLDRRRCERQDNPPTERPPQDWLLAEYAQYPAHVIASRLGVSEACVYRWIEYARNGYGYVSPLRPLNRAGFRATRPGA